MLKTTEQLKEQAKKIDLHFFPVHECSVCGYSCGYRISGDFESVGYDSGCYCVSDINVSPSSWEELTNTYNLNQPENNSKITKSYLKELNDIWKFEDVAEELKK